MDASPAAALSTSNSASHPSPDHVAHVYEAQVELGYAWDMLEVLIQLTVEATEREPLPLEGWFGLLSAIQERIGAGRRVLGKSVKQH